MDGYTFSCPIQIRWRDLDAFGHVNNATFASYLEMARTEVWTALFGGRDALAIPFFVKRLEIVYRRPISLADEVRVRIRVGETRGASFTFEYLVEAGGEIAAEAVTKLACVDKTTGKPVPIEPEVRAKLEGMSFEVSNVLYPQLNLRSTVFVFLFSVAISSLASFIPSRRAARIEPVEALRAV